MTSSINAFSFSKSMNLTIINNASKLSSFEQKNLAILILARHKLAFFVKQNKEDEFINNLYCWLESNVIDFRDIDIAFTTYNNTKDGTPLKKELFKIVKPLEELAVYLSKMAEINNNMNKEFANDLFYTKIFILYLLYLWFDVFEKKTYYFREIHNFKIKEELQKIKCVGYSNIASLEDKDNINYIIGNSKEIATFLSNYVFKIILNPKSSYKKRHKK